MLSLPGKAGRRRKRIFVDRERELVLFQNALKADKPQWNIIEISGVGGMGKTFLLLRYLDFCAELKVPTVLVDGQDIECHTIGGFTQFIARQLMQQGFERFFERYKALRNDYVQERALVSWEFELIEAHATLDREFALALNRIANQHGRLVLAIDTFERLAGTSVENWLRDSFLPFASTAILLVISGRTKLGSGWEAWHPVMISTELRPFSPTVVNELLASRTMTATSLSEAANTVHQVTGGLPLGVALFADLIQEDPRVFDSPIAAGEITGILVDRLTQTVGTFDKRLLEALSVLSPADEELLAYVTECSTVEISDHLQSLRYLAFIKTTVRGIQLHDVVRDVLSRELRYRSPLRYRNFHERALAFYMRQLRDPTRQSRWVESAPEALHHCLQIEEAEALTLCQELFYVGIQQRHTTACRSIIHTLRRHSFGSERLREQASLLDVRLSRRLNCIENALLGWESRDSLVLTRSLAQLLGLDSTTTQNPDAVPGWTVCDFDAMTLLDDVSPPMRLPCLVYAGSSLPENAVMEVRSLLKDFSTAPIPVALVLTYEEFSNMASLQLLVARMRHAYALDLVTIGKDDFHEIIFSPEPKQALRRRLLTQVDLRSISPFVINGPAPDDVFFGREDILRELVEHIRGSSYALIGGRRFGKSSVLFRLHRMRLPAAGLRSGYYDCSTMSTHQAFLSASIRDWQPSPPPGAVTKVVNLLESPPTDMPLVLLLDEADKLVLADQASGWRLFSALRALGNAQGVQVVISGERILRDALHDATSPLFNFANELLLGQLDYHAVEELVTSPMKRLGIDLVIVYHCICKSVAV